MKAAKGSCKGPKGGHFELGLPLGQQTLGSWFAHVKRGRFPLRDVRQVEQDSPPPWLLIAQGARVSTAEHSRRPLHLYNASQLQ